MIEILEPMWRKDTGKRCVGLAEFRLRMEGDLTEVRITYRRKSDGKRVYPHIFVIQTHKCFNYPSSWVGGGNVKVYWIPIEDMKEIIPESKPEHKDHQLSMI